MSVAHTQLPVIWHDLECGAYRADLILWRTLAEEYGDPVLEIGAGTGRVAIGLARCGHHVMALDRDPILIGELARRAGGLPINTVVADARTFELDRRFPLIIVPMQTIQLLGGGESRQRFLACAASHLRPGGVLAIAITEMLEPFSVGDGIVLPTPDMREIGGVVYSSQPTAVRRERRGFLVERLRESIDAHGARAVEHDVIRLDHLTAPELEREGGSLGLVPSGREVVPPTEDHVGSVVVKLRG